uniref:(northern house mosquito) hypothetical protein n=1 Tax=Culex pipiens TaxID=7175 RepID=A0A8D8ABT7_CULPI
MPIRASAIASHSLSRARECISKYARPRGKATNTTPATVVHCARRSLTNCARAGYRGLSTRRGSRHRTIKSPLQIYTWLYPPTKFFVLSRLLLWQNCGTSTTKWVHCDDRS